MNDDCLRHIFRYLLFIDRVRIQRVCKRWKIISSELIETKIDLALFKIFQFVPIVYRIKIERVSKRWRDISKATYFKLTKLNYTTLWGLRKRTWHDVPQLSRVDPMTLQRVLLRCGENIDEVDLQISRLGIKRRASPGM